MPRLIGTNESSYIIVIIEMIVFLF